MKELENKKENIEISVKQKKQVEHELIGKIIPHHGHIIWEINKETLEVTKAKFSSASYQMFGDIKKEIIVKEGFYYVSALNTKNALKKYLKGKNGSKEMGDFKMWNDFS
jgi:hypothetical protein